MEPGRLPARLPGSIADVVRLGAERFGNREMVVFEGRRVSYRELDERANRIANGMRALGVGENDVVASIAYNSDHLLALYFAIAKCGAISVPLNTMLTADDVAGVLRRSGARALVFGEEQHELVAELPADASLRRIAIGATPVAGADALDALEQGSSAEEPPPAKGDHRPSTVLYTSGTTGPPKGCTKTHANQIWSAINCQLETPRRADSVELYAIPLAGVGFANFVLPTFLVGGRVALARFDPGVCLDLIERERVTNVFLAGTMLSSILRHPGQETRDLSSLELVETAYQLSDSLREGIAARFGPIVRYCYGSSEGSNWAAPADVFLSRPDCVGFPKGFDDFRVVDEQGRDVPRGDTGEVMVGGPTVMLGYFGDEEGSAGALRDGWLLTGDLGAVDHDGMLLFRGRKKDMIKSGGYNVPAGEVELALARHPLVVEAAVIGVADEHWGEAVRAVVVAERGCDEAELRRHCRGALAGHFRPKDFVFVDEIPKNPGGKVAKGVVRERWGGA